MSISSQITIRGRHIPINLGNTTSFKRRNSDPSFRFQNQRLFHSDPSFRFQNERLLHSEPTLSPYDIRRNTPASISPALVAKHGLGLGGSITAYLTLLLAGIIHSSAGTQITNDAVEGIGYAPIAINAKIDEPHRFDRFIKNSPEFKSIQEAIIASDINIDDLSNGDDGVLLSSRRELSKLISKLEHAAQQNPTKKPTIEKGLAALKETRTIHSLVFGDEELDPAIVSQKGEPNCQGMSALKGMLFTTKNTQHLKAQIEVTSFNPESPANLINFNVTLNGKTIPISYSEIIDAMGKKYTFTSQSKDDSLFTTIYSLALKKAAPDVTPNIAPSTSPILLTSQGYDTALLYTFSDTELEELFKQAPEKLILVAGTFSFEGIINAIKLRQEATQKEELSLTKVSNFVSIQKNRSTERPEIEAAESLDIMPDAPQKYIFASSFPTSNTGKIDRNEKTLSAEHVRQLHIYVVEKYDSEKKELTISDAHGDKVRLNLNEAREHLITTIAPSSEIDPYNSSLPFSLLCLAAMASMFKLERKKVYGVGGAIKAISKTLTKKASTNDFNINTAC